MERGEVDHVLDTAEHGIVDPHGSLEALAAMHDAVANGLDVADCADDRSRLLRREPTNDMVDGRAKVAKWRRAARRRLAGAQCEDRLAANALDLPAGELFIGVLGDALGVCAHELQLERG